MMKIQKLTIFYDSYCPLCVAEMNKLHELDVKHSLSAQTKTLALGEQKLKLEMVDLFSEDFEKNYPHINVEAATNRLHAQTDQGEILTGLDVTHIAWQLVGKGYLTAPLRWPVLRYFTDMLYLFFAEHRYKISYWLTGKARCQVCINKNSCELTGNDSRPL